MSTATLQSSPSSYSVKQSTNDVTMTSIVYTGSGSQSLPYRFSWDEEDESRSKLIHAGPATIKPGAIVRLRSFDEGTQNTMKGNENDGQRQNNQQFDTEKLSTVLPQEIRPRCTQRWQCNHPDCSKLVNRYIPFASTQSLPVKRNPVEPPHVIYKKDDTQKKVKTSNTTNSHQDVVMIDSGNPSVTVSQISPNTALQNIGSLQTKGVKYDSTASKINTYRSQLLANIRAARNEWQQIRSVNKRKRQKQEAKKLALQVKRNKGDPREKPKRQSKKEMQIKQKVQRLRDKAVPSNKRRQIQQKRNNKEEEELLENIEHKELYTNPAPNMIKLVRKLTSKHIDKISANKRLLMSPCSKSILLQHECCKKTKNVNKLKGKQIRKTKEIVTLFDDPQLDLEEDLKPQQLFTHQQPQQLQKLSNLQQLQKPQEPCKPQSLHKPQQSNLQQSQESEQLFKHAQPKQLFKPQQLFKLQRSPQPQQLFNLHQPQQPQQLLKSEKLQQLLILPPSQQLFKPQQSQQSQQLYKPQQQQQSFNSQQPQQLQQPMTPQQPKLIGEILVLNKDSQQEKKPDSNRVQHGDKKSIRPQNTEEKLGLTQDQQLCDTFNKEKQHRELGQQNSKELGIESQRDERSTPMVAIGSLNENGITRSFYISSEFIPDLLETLPPSDNLNETRLDHSVDTSKNVRPEDPRSVQASAKPRPIKVSRKRIGYKSSLSLDSTKLNNALPAQDLLCYEQFQETDDRELHRYNMFDKLKVKLINKQASSC